MFARDKLRGPMGGGFSPGNALSSFSPMVPQNVPTMQATNMPMQTMQDGSAIPVGAQTMAGGGMGSLFDRFGERFPGLGANMGPNGPGMSALSSWQNRPEGWRNDWREAMMDWRGDRPMWDRTQPRPEDWRTQITDWRAARPDFRTFFQGS